MAKPVCIDLFCGLGGWADGFLAAGFDVIGFDIERHDYGTGGYPGQLVLQNVQTIHGSRFAGVACIVASPPCQQYSYRAMPWKRAKALPPPDDTLFFECWRIREEASAAAGRRIPLIVENVCGAQKWVGRARWHFGSYYLWGDVPALMPFVRRQVMKAGVTHRSDDSTHWRRATKNSGGSWFNVAHNTTSGKSQSPVHDGVKQGGDWFGETGPGQMRSFASKSPKRKAATAAIAKIPFPLASWIARCFYPRTVEAKEVRA